MSRKKKHKVNQMGAPIDLNIMPFIDVFSLLCTFLLFSAVFVTIGITEVQAPFLTNAVQKKSDNKKDENKKSLPIFVHISKNSVSIRSASPGEAEKTSSFSSDKNGLLAFHQNLVSLKEKFPDSDKATVLTEEDVDYSSMIFIFDLIKFHNLAASEENKSNSLLPKIVLGDIIL